MATYEELLAEYRRSHAELHKQVAQKTGYSEEEMSNLFVELLYQAQQEEQQFSELKPEPQTIYNWLRFYALQFNVLSDLFENVSIQEQHRFCQYVKGQLPASLSAHLDVLGAVQQAFSFVRKDFALLVLKNPRCGREELIAWIQPYLDREIQVLLFTNEWETLKFAIQSHARKKTKGSEETEDLLMQTYLKALKYIRVHHKLPEEGKMKAWLMVIMNHAYLDIVREQGDIAWQPLDDQIELHPDGEDVEKRVIDELGKQELARLLRSLPADARRVMEMHLLQGMPLSEIAEVLGEKLETIRARYKRARPLVLAHLSAKTLNEYLKRIPGAYHKIQTALRSYTPGRTARHYTFIDLKNDNEVTILVRYILSLYIEEGYDARAIAGLLALEKNEEETEEAFAQRMATTQKSIQKCLNENLPRLFSSYYGKNQ